MGIEIIEKTLSRLSELIASDHFDELETDTVEIKPVPSVGNEWREIYKSICAFLNTRGGIVIFGIKERGEGQDRRYIFTRWQPYAEPNLKELPKQFTKKDGSKVDIKDSFPPPILIDFMSGKVAVQLVDALPADQKYVFYDGVAYKRFLTGDHKITEAEISRQEEFREEALQARELQPVEGMTISDLDLDKLNNFIFQLNQLTPLETIKSDLDQALPFIERRCFIKEGQITTLGALVCGKHLSDKLGFRAQVHGYVDVPQEVARDKQDFSDNVLQLMSFSLGYLLRNIQVGISAEQGGISRPQYPEELLRETVNNALAHRDYSINRQVIVAVKPGEYVSIQNPGSFRKHLLIERPDDTIPIRRIIPEAKPRNPKLADVLRVFRKWEGRGIGMATLVNMCLENRIDMPFYHLGTEAVSLFLRNGRLLDERMERLFKSFDRYIIEKLKGNALTETQKLVLSYLIKSEWANELVQYTVLLTPDNNHFGEIKGLEEARLIEKHPASTSNYPIYVADRNLMRKDYLDELRAMFSPGIDSIDPFLKEILGVIYRFNKYSKSNSVSAKEASFYLWAARGGADDIKQFDIFYRKVRHTFNQLKKVGYIRKIEGSHGYVLDSKAANGLFGVLKS